MTPLIVVHMGLSILLIITTLDTIATLRNLENIEDEANSEKDWNQSENVMESNSIIKQARMPVEESVEIRLRVPERRRVRQDIYNFYNSHQPPQNQRPNYLRPRPRPRPPPLPPNYDDYADYDDASDPNYDWRPPYRPYYRPPRPPPSTTTTSTTTTTAAPNQPLKPIGYMLIDTYHTPAGSYSRPIAFFGS